jgi:hypothetical protein
MIYKKSEIKVDSKLNGIYNPNKIQNIYERVKATCGIRFKRPFNEKIGTPEYFDISEALYGREMYQTEVAIITFKIYGFFDPINQVQIKNKDPSNKYVSAKRMEIIVNTKRQTLIDSINSIIKYYPNQPPRP